MAVMNDATFVWSDDQGTGRNRFVLFRRGFALDAVPATALLHLFADTRYRIWVNGTVAGYGPARFVPSHPEADAIDLAPWLRTGANTVLVEVNHRGASAYDALPSIGGFIAWGAAGAADLATPGAWRCRVAEAWDGEAPCWSFAQGPIEICDTRQLPAAWYQPGEGGAGWKPTVALARQDHWGRPAPRSIPPMDMAERVPAAVTLVATLRSELRVGVREDGKPSGNGVRRRSAYALCLHSPREQEAVLGMFWGPHWCNGQEIAMANHAFLGNRQDGRVRLREGWNLIYGEPEAMADAWPVLVAVPGGLGLAVSASEDPTDPAWMLHAGTFTDLELAAWRARAPASSGELPTPPGGWKRVPRGHRPVVPARDAGWDQPDRTAAHPPQRIAPVALPSADGDAIAVVEVEAPAGTVLDLAIAERRRDDGLLALFKTHWMTNEAERFVLRGGVQRVEGFNQRGGRYLAVIARGAGAAATIRRVAVRDTLYPLERVGRFACSDPTLTWIHQAGDATLRACMEDAFVDCPWRERGCYVGDALVQFHAARTLGHDLALVKRCLRLFAQAQRADGLIHDVAPAWLDSPLLDYVYAWISALREVWSVSGDLALVRELWPHVVRIFAGSAWQYGPDGLVQARPGQRVFIDWGAPRRARDGVSGPLNAFHAQALADAAELAAAIGAGEAVAYAARRDAVRAAFQRALWDPAQGAFVDAVIDGEPLAGRALHTNSLALAFGLVPAGGEAGVVARLSGEALTGGRSEGQLDTYAFYFLLLGLYRAGRADLAEAATRESYGPMRDGGAWTLWESFVGKTSLCHAWSCGPMRFFAERVLGVRPRVAGDPDDLLIAPESALAAASGIVPHARGPIHVAWERQGGVLSLRLAAPAGVRVTVAPAGPLADCRVLMRS
jgi:hypothetical protein